MLLLLPWLWGVVFAVDTRVDTLASLLSCLSGGLSCVGQHLLRDICPQTSMNIPSSLSYLTLIETFSNDHYFQARKKQLEMVASQQSI